MRLCVRSEALGDLREGDVIARIPDRATPGRMETPENGYVWIEVPDSDGLEFFENTEIDNPEWNVLLPEGSPIRQKIPGPRKKQISLDTPIQVSKVTSKHSHSFKHNSGKSFRKHLMSGQVMSANKSGLIIKNG